MYMRLFKLRIKHELISQYFNFYRNKAMPELEKAKGCHFVGLLESMEDSSHLISMTLWDDPQNSTTFEQSNIYRKLLDENLPFLALSSELDFQMSDDFPEPKIHVTGVPEISTYDIAVQSESFNTFPTHADKMYVRILSLKVKPEKLKEFENIYLKEIIPAVKKVKGLRYDFLTESIRERSEIIAITIWDSMESSENYEKSGQFKSLLTKLDHTFPEEAENDYPFLEQYLMITGKQF